MSTGTAQKERATTQSGSTPAPTGGGSRATRPEPKRINVAITPGMVKALERVIEGEGASLTEALRRLVMIGDFVYTQVNEEGARVQVINGDTVREVVLLT